MNYGIHKNIVLTKSFHLNDELKIISFERRSEKLLKNRKKKHISINFSTISFETYE